MVLSRSALVAATIACAVLTDVSAASADDDAVRPFVLTDLSDGSSYGLETTFGSLTVGGEDESREVFNVDFALRVRVAERAHLLFRYALGWLSGFSDSTASSIPARGDMTLGLLHRFGLSFRGSPLALGVSGVVSFPMATDKLGASNVVSGLHAVHDPGLYNNEVVTARLAIDARRQSGRYFAQLQAALHAQLFGTSSEGRLDTLLLRVGALGGMELTGGLSAVAELTAFTGLGSDTYTLTDMAGEREVLRCQGACPAGWSDGPVHAPAINLGLRYDRGHLSAGAHAFVPLTPAMIEQLHFGVGVDIAYVVGP